MVMQSGFDTAYLQQAEQSSAARHWPDWFATQPSVLVPLYYVLFDDSECLCTPASQDQTAVTKCPQPV